MTPLNSWLGNKSWLGRPEHAHRFPDWETVDAINVPFVGAGGFVYGVVAEIPSTPVLDAEGLELDSGAPALVLSDTNGHIIALFSAVLEFPEALAGDVSLLAYSQETFLAAREHINLVRHLDPHQMARNDLVKRAACFLAVVQFGFNGLYRENRKGECNVAFGRPGKPMPTREAIFAAHQALGRRSECTILHCDFEKGLGVPGPGCYYYFDCPYDETFTGYGWAGFSSGKAASDAPSLLDVGLPTRSDLARLASVCERVHDAGALFLLSQSNTPLVRRMFERWTIEEVSVPRSVSCDGATRGSTVELLIRNY